MDKKDWKQSLLDSASNTFFIGWLSQLVVLSGLLFVFSSNFDRTEGYTIFWMGIITGYFKWRMYQKMHSEIKSLETE